MLFVFISFVGCSAIQETETKNTADEKSVYVFDDVTVNDSTNNVAEEIVETKPIENKTFEMYIVQVGAFSTREKAELFVTQVKNKTEHELNIIYNVNSNLYVIQLSPFRTREEADKVRDELRTIPELKGTFIVPNK